MPDTSDSIARLTADNHALRQRVAELEQRLDMLTYELEQERSLLRGVLDDAPVAVAVTDMQGHYLVMNRYMQQVFGVSIEQVVQQHYSSIMPPSLLSVVDPIFHQVQTRNVMQIDEYPVTLPGGTGHFQTIMYPVHDSAGCPIAVGIISIDITERKQTDHERKLARFSLNRAADAIYQSNTQGSFIYVNESACRCLGYTRSELLQLSILDVDAQLTAEAVQDVIQSLRTQGSITIESVHRRKDATLFPVEVTVSYTEFDGLEYITSFARDITERKRYEDELRVFKTIIDNSPDGIGVTDAAGKITYANPAHRRMFGYGEEIIGMDMAVTLAPEAHVIMEQAMQVIMTEGSWIGESLNQRKDGTLFPVDAAIFALSDDQQQLQGLAGIIRDISDRKQSEQERIDLQERIINAQRDALREISTPIIPIARDVVIMPLIGAIDSQRAQMVMETLIEGVARHQANIAILDITGVSIVDTQVANALIIAAHAVRLLGAQVILTGIQPQIAQTLVHLGVDLNGIITRGSLQNGITDALEQRV